MTVSEFIKLWDTINISTIPFQYYYKNSKTTKHDLYKEHSELHTIKLLCKQQDLNEYDIVIHHNYLENFNYDQQVFYNNLRLEIPDSATVNNIHMYIE